jgi:hypothetical protein
MEASARQNRRTGPAHLMRMSHDGNATNGSCIAPDGVGNGSLP